jgi:hypothetical protein
MAKATAVCTCRECGKEFEKTKTCYNRRDADSWETWAASHYDLCPTCYGKQQAEKEKALGLVYDIRVNTGLTRERGEIMCTIIAAGDSYSYKDQLKALGCKFGEDIPDKNSFSDLLGLERPRKAWHKHFPLSQMKKIISEFESIGGTGRDIPNRTDFVLAAEVAADAKKRIDAKTAAVNAVKATRPVKPECYPDGKWNGKVYGRIGSRNIYVDGNKVEISDEDAVSLESYAEAMVEYNKRLADANRTGG